MVRDSCAMPYCTNPHVFGTQQSAPLSLHDVHLVAAPFATKPVPHPTLVPFASRSPHLFATQHSSP